MHIHCDFITFIFMYMYFDCPLYWEGRGREGRGGEGRREVGLFPMVALPLFLFSCGSRNWFRVEH